MPYAPPVRPGLPSARGKVPGTECKDCVLLLAWQRLKLHLEAVQAAIAGGGQATPAPASPDGSDADDPPKSGLTRREREVHLLLIAGCIDREVAAALGIRLSTARGYATEVLAKRGVHSRRHLRHPARSLPLQNAGVPPAFAGGAAPPALLPSLLRLPRWAPASLEAGGEEGGIDDQ